MQTVLPRTIFPETRLGDVLDEGCATVRRAAKVFLRARAHLGGRPLLVSGKFPAEGGRWMVVCNHASFLDTMHWMSVIRSDFVVAGANPRLYRNALLRTAMRMVNVLRLETDRQLVGDASALLSLGVPLLVYPAHTRDKLEGRGEFRPLAAEIAIRTGCDIYPACITGTALREKGPVRMAVGEALRAEHQETAAALTVRLAEEVEKLRGVCSLDRKGKRP